MSDKVMCQECKKFEHHILIPHIKKEHPKLGIQGYLMKHDSPIASEHGWAELNKHHPDIAPVRATKKAKVHELFGLAPFAKGDSENREFVNKEINIFADRVPHVPEIDEDYIFQEGPLRCLLMALALEKRNRTWLHGYPGTGKTDMVLQVCARVNHGVVRINGDSHISRRQLIGDMIVRNGEMIFQYGVLPMAMKRGDVLLIDEVDCLNPATLAILRSVLADPSTLVILENGGEVIHAHPSFRVIATANTAGSGDDTGLYATSRSLSVADRQRFAIWSQVEYLKPETETKMLKKKFPDLTDDEVERFIKVATSIRDRFIKGEFEESFSPRELINWAEKFMMVGYAMESAQMCFLDRYQNVTVKTAVAELIKAAFGTSASAGVKS